MILATFIALLFVNVSLALHLFNLSWLTEKLARSVRNQWLKVQIIFVVAVVSHMLVAGVFTFSYVLGVESGIGTFASPMNLTDIYYFSLISLTTLGLGVVEPLGHLRMFAGVEAAMGFLLISCSASRVFQAITGQR